MQQSNNDILDLCKTKDIHTDVCYKKTNLGHLARQSNKSNKKRLLFNDNKRTKPGRPMETLEDKVIKSTQRTKDQFYKDALNRKGHDRSNRSDRRLSQDKDLD